MDSLVTAAARALKAGDPLGALKRIAGGASAPEKQAMFSGTARRVYRLDA